MAKYVVIDSSNVIETIAISDSALESNWHLVADNFDGSPGDTYVASTSTLTKAAPSFTVDEAREEAKRILTATDWTQLQDVGLTDTNVIEWKTYRASIRAIYQSPTANPTWPTEPSTEYS